MYMQTVNFFTLIPAADSKFTIMILGAALEQEVRLGYWQHVEFSWTDAVRISCYAKRGSFSCLAKEAALRLIAL